MKAEKEQKCNARRIKGITLIALVITIVVLLILAAVSITAVFGDNGLLKMAKDAGDKTNEAVGKEQEGMANVSGILGEYTNDGGSGSSGTTNPTPSPMPTEASKPTTVAEAVAQNYKFTENTDIKDAYGNPVTIPAGFRIVPNGESYVKYTYSGDNIPAVQDGIVIEDAEPDSNGEKNQFVWIPVCTEEKAGDGTITIKRKIKNRDNTESEIRLARYEFDIKYNSSSSSYEGTGAATPKQYALNYTDEGEDTKINTNYQELVTSTYGNTTAGDRLKTFVEKSNEKGGYYLARYEAVKGKGENPKVKSMASTLNSANNINQSVNSGMVWNQVKQPNASDISRAMYDDNDNFETDLVNSYAWDTAIVFIQTYSGKSSYSKQNSTITGTPGKTGERTDGTTDKVCNIYDMASNMVEWSTETSSSISGSAEPCVWRGGNYFYNDQYAGQRWSTYLSAYVYYVYSFRPLLYIK